MKTAFSAFEAHQLTASEVHDIYGGFSIAVLAPAPEGLSPSLTDRINLLAERFNRLAIDVANLYQEKIITTQVGNQILTTIGYEATDPAKAQRLSTRMNLIAKRYAQLLA